MSDIVLTAGVRQNLLALQTTANLMSITQNRLATGKKVNTALDNPANFFTSQSLSLRANDLNALLDSIGQAQKTLEAADKGLTAISKLVQSAKSIALQARQAALSVSSYAAVNANADIAAVTNLNGDEVIGELTGNNTTLPTGNFDPVAIAKTFTLDTETLASHDGGTIAVANSTTYSFDIAINGGPAINVTYTSDASATYAEIRDGLIADFDTKIGIAGFTGRITLAQGAGGDDIAVAAVDSDIDFVISNNTNAGLTDAAYDSISLLDRVVAAGGVAGSSSLAVSVSGGAAQTITFGTGSGQISRISELNTALQALTGGVSASAAAGANGLSFSLAAGATNSIGLSATDVGVRDALGLDSARTVGQGGGLGTTATELTRTYNSAATLADADPTNLLNGGNLTITVNGSAQTIGLVATDRLADIIAKLQSNATLNNNLAFSNAAGELRISAKTADVDFTITHNNTSAAIGLTSGSNVTTNSTSLFDRLSAPGVLGSNAQGSTLTVQASGGIVHTLTFGTGANEISTKQELTDALANLSGLTATLNGTTLNIQVDSDTSPTSLTIGGTAAQRLGLIVGTVNGIETPGAPNSVRATLQTDFNNVLTQIDGLAKDASYNGINLLDNDDLKVVFNEKGTSSLTIDGVKMNSAGLGLSAANGTAFQVNATIDVTITTLDTALTALRTQASKFGSRLTTVQVRQDFTKELITTLNTGSDQLVLADTNEEGANLLALQTRQQLSTTALSLSAQAAQAVLRLFG